MDGPQTADRPSLLELVDPRRWQRLQDHFAGVLGVPLRTVDPSHELLIAPSWPCGFETERAVGLLRIGEELDELLPAEHPPTQIATLGTPLGITYAAVPIRPTAEIALAYYVVGPMVVGPREGELQFRQRMADLGLDASMLWPLLLSLKLFSFSSIRSALNLVEEVGGAIAQFAHQAHRVTALLPAARQTDHVVVRYHTERILRSLLEAAILATKADGGSIMLRDPQTGRLAMMAAQGLSDAIVQSAGIGRGEGLAWLAAQERRILLVDATTPDQRLRALMRRPDLVSSLVAPLGARSGLDPIGVLNLRTSRAERRFTGEHLELLRRLLELTGAALNGLHGAPAPSLSSSSL